MQYLGTQSDGHLSSDEDEGKQISVLPRREDAKGMRNELEKDEARKERGTSSPFPSERT